jgi:hypothetical protein
MPCSGAPTLKFNAFKFKVPAKFPLFLRCGITSPRKVSPLRAKLNKTPASARLSKFFMIAMIALMGIAIAGSLLKKFTVTDADDPVAAVAARLLNPDKGKAGATKDARRDAHENGLVKILDGEVDLGGIIPEPDVLTDPRENSDPARRELMDRSVDPGFPPEGTRLGKLPAKIFFENQRRYDDVKLELVRWRDSVFLSGAGRCEVVQSKYVLLKPCIFREKIVDVIGEDRSPYEIELLLSLSLFLSLPFEGYARHISSVLGCGNTADYKMSVQFMRRIREGYISVRLPYSVSEVEALDDLKANAARPCRGMDIFFEPEQLVKILALIELQRTKNPLQAE